MSAPLSKELRSQHGVRMNDRKAGTNPLRMECCVHDVCINARTVGSLYNRIKYESSAG